MSDYTKALNGLRHCINLDGLEPNDTRIRCHGCPYFTEPTRCGGILMRDAAAAIEELQAEVESMDESCKKQLVAMASHVADLQAEVERLEPKQRKLGRWEKAKPKGVVVYSDGYAECSSCHEVIWLGWGMNFCPHCGVQNRIIDPDDMAKMEVQDGQE